MVFEKECAMFSCDAVVQEGRTIVTVIADGGPDWSTASILNALYYMHLCRRCDLDMFCLTLFAARYQEQIRE